MPGRALTPKQIATLEACYREGVSPNVACKAAQCSDQTAYRYYATFEARGIQRVGRDKAPASLRGAGWPAPYTGPEWIGKRA